MYSFVKTIVDVESNQLVGVEKAYNMVFCFFDGNDVDGHWDTCWLENISMEDWYYKEPCKTIHNGNLFISKIELLHSFGREHHFVHTESNEFLVLLQRFDIYNFKLTFITFIRFLALTIKISLFINRNSIYTVKVCNDF